LAIIDRVKSAWNAFRNTEPEVYSPQYGSTSSYSQSHSRPAFGFYNERSIVSAIYNRIAIDVADLPIYHILMDELGRYKSHVGSQLNYCLTIEPNIDQAPRAFRQDVVMNLFSSGCVAIVPVDTTINPETGQFDIDSLRAGEIKEWYPKHVKVDLYNEEKGLRQEVVLEKRFVAIIENPLYAVMNEPNSTLQRLIRKLSLLDAIDEQSASGKLDIIIQLPYVIKSEARKAQAEQRREDIEFQLKGSKYGIAYTEATEKITQLNRPAENNLMSQVEYLVNMLYGQLGITEDVMNGTADEAAMINYNNRTVKPIVESIVEGMQRSFLGPRNLSNDERILYFKDPFKLVSAADFAEIADKFTRNEILSSNEIRGYMGIPPSDDPKADQLVNSNINPSVPTDSVVTPKLKRQLKAAETTLRKESQNGS